MNTLPDDMIQAIDLARLLQHEALAGIKHSFVGKDEIVDLMGIALVARENLFLYGPPGTAKTALVHALARSLEARSFDYLLTRFTEPGEIFGPFDIRRLRDGDLVTNTEGMMPEADLVFLDELLNANSAILNSLLMALNERVFRRGRETRALPALMFVGASNHLPRDDALQALFDRFLLRCRCGQVPAAGLAAVLDAGWSLQHATVPAGRLSAEHVRLVQAACSRVDLSPAREAYLGMVLKLREAGIAISDRRAVRLQRAVAASALLSGRAHAQPSDLWVFRHIWDREEQIDVLESIVGECLRKTEPTPGDHPRSRSEETPDPEALAAALGALAPRLAASAGGADAAYALDELRMLASRVEWVANEEARNALRARVQQLWPPVKG